MSILKTKLHRPHITKDLVLRSDVIENLSKNRQLPLTLVSAPAGYGKSITISQWIEKTHEKHAWLSLDEDHNDLRVFLEYFIVAIRLSYPSSMLHFDPIVSGVELPSIKTLVYELLNELDEFPEQFTVVFDDYHLIKNESIHELINGILEYPPQNIHFIIISRTDPPLRLNNLRAYGRINELRVASLCFTINETEQLFATLTSRPLDDRTIEHLFNKTEGWIIGLRLAYLYANEASDVNEALLGVKGDIRLIANFMIEEILSKQSSFMLQYLLSTSVLDRFSAELVEAIVEPTRSETNKGTDFIKGLVKSNFFLIPLDYEDTWFRFHHLFKDLLFEQLKRRISDDQIAKIHYKAAQWYKAHDLYDEAIEHFIKAGEVSSASQIVEKHAHRVYENGGMVRVASWLNNIPSEEKDKDPVLLLIQAWDAFGSFHLEKIPPILEKVELICKGQTIEPLLAAQIDFFNGNLLYWMGGTNLSIKTLQRSLVHTSDLPNHVLCNIELVLNLARQRNGEEAVLIKELQLQIREKDTKSPYYIAFSYGSLAFILLLSGRVIESRTMAGEMQKSASETKIQFLFSWGQYLEASANLQLLNLDEALTSFEEVYKMRYNVDSRAILDTLAGLALVHQLKHQSEDAQKTIELLDKYAQQLGDPQSKVVAQSARFRIALLQGSMDKAVQWTSSIIDPPVFAGLFIWLEVPWITQAKILIAEGSAHNLTKGIRLLEDMFKIVLESHLFYHQIEIVVWLSLANFKQGNEKEALDMLEKVVTQTKSKDWVRPFVETGDQMIDLLIKLKERELELGFVDKVLKLIYSSASGNRKTENRLGAVVQLQNSHEKISLRELDVLQYASKGYRNKEIALKLFVSEATIKKHLYNIFRKLGVNNRIAMVQAARDLGIITEPQQ